jgi:glycosyltransferase involved in cell wall biosynthesis
LAVIHYAAAPIPGGVELAIGAQVARLRRAGYDVRLLAGRGDAEVIEELDSRHPEVERVTRALAAGREPTEFDDLRRRISKRLGSALADRDLVVAHNVITMPFNLPLTAALLDRQQPLVAWTHDIAWTNEQYASFRRELWPFVLLGRRHPRVTYVVISRQRQAELAAAFRMPSRDVHLVPNAVDPLEFSDLGAHARQLLERAGALNASPLVLVPLRVTPRKRLELALAAAAELSPRMPELRMVVTGPLGPHNADNRRYADSLLRQRSRLGLDSVVSFLFQQARPDGKHPVRNKDVAELYRISDVVLLPTEAEGFGLPLLEAALARVPVVCTDLPVLREVGGVGPYTFPPGADGSQVARQLERALNQRAVRQRRRAIRRYSWPVVLERTERVIGAAVEG